MIKTTLTGLFLLVLSASASAVDAIEYCKVKYESMLMQQGVTREKLMNPFYDDYYHVFLRRQNELLSFEPSNKIRVGDVTAALGLMMFVPDQCEPIKIANSANIALIWQALTHFFVQQANSFSYSVSPEGTGGSRCTDRNSKNGHFVVRDALNSLKLPLPAMDETMNPILKTMCK